MSVVSGNPEALDGYAEASATTLEAWPIDWADYAQPVVAYNAAPSDLSHTALNLHSRLVGMRSRLRTTTSVTVAFAKALRSCDRIIGPVPAGVRMVADSELFDALLAAWTADPDATTDEAMAAALDTLTGSPEQLADEFADIIDDLDVDRDDIDELQFELQNALAEVTSEAANNSHEPYPTPEELAERAWERVADMGAWDELDPSIGVRLAEATSKLERRANDPAYLEDFFVELGPEDTLGVAETASIVAWNDAYRDAGRAPSTGHTIEVVSEALATASPGLGEDFAQDLVDSGLTEEHEDTNGWWPGGGRDYLELNDALPLLFSSGEFSTEFSTVIGQLGIDVLAGEQVEENGDRTDIDVGKGLGSPFMDGFDQLETAWQGRGAVLIDAAARNAGAANALLHNDRNLRLLTDDQLSWRDTDHVWFDEDVGRWDVIGGPINDLIVAGTVEFEAQDRVAARDAAANVVQWATEEGPGAASDALAPAYGDIITNYLEDFSLQVPTSRGEILDPFVHTDGRMYVPFLTSAQFTSLAVSDEATAAEIVAARDRALPILIITGIEYGRTDPDWEYQVAKIDAMITAGLNGATLLSASESAAAAESFNENVDLARESILGFLPTDKIPLGSVQDRLIDELTEEYLHRPTDQMDGARHDVNLTVDTVSGSQQLIIADAHLAVAVREVVAGTDGPAHQAVLDTARSDLGHDYVDALISNANGDPVELPDLTTEQVSVWAGHADSKWIEVVANKTDRLLPEEPEALFR
jgi:hypothetical protein